MYVDPVSTVTSVGQVVAVLRDGIATVAVCVIGWKARDWVQPAFDFFKKANLFMDESSKSLKDLSEGLTLIRTNDLKHLPGEIAVAINHKPEVITLGDGGYEAGTPNKEL
jgi:hypothetical protein